MASVVPSAATATSRLEDEVARQLKAEQVRQIYESSIPAVLVNLLNAVILSAVLWDVVPHITLILWLGFGIISGGFRAITTLNNQAAFQRGEPVTQKHRNEQIAGVALFSLFWMASIIFLFPEEQYSHLFFLAFIIAGMTAGGVTLLGIDRLLTHIFITPILLLLALRLFMHELSLISLSMAFLALIYLGTLLLFASKLRHRLLEIVRMRIQSQSDAEALQLGDAAFEASGPLIITDKEGHILRCNRAFSQMSGYSRESVIGRRSNILNSGRHGPDFYQAMWRSLEHNGHWEGEIWNRRKSGEEFPCLLSISAMKGAEGDTRHFIGSLVDISELKRQHALIEQNADMEQTLSRLLRLALDDSPMQGYLSEALRLTITSTPWLRLLPRGAIFLRAEDDPEALQIAANYQLSFELKVLCERIPFGQCLCGRAAQSGKAVFADHIDHRHDIRFEGIEEHGHYVMPIMRGDELLGVLALYLEHAHPHSAKEQEFLERVTDILGLGISRRLSEQQMRAARELAEKASQAKSEFLSSMSHELRTPLNAIMGFAQLLEMDAQSSAQRDQLKEINQASEHLLGLINEILDLAKIEAGKVDLDIGEHSIKGITDNCLSLTRSMAEARGIRMSSEIHDPTLSVRADQTRLRQILLNLISNGIKYNREGGSLSLSLETPDEEHLRIRVSDTGRGLSEEQLERLFQPFERLGQEHHTVEGTGIGLVITRSLAEMMGGSVGVESELGVGSSFWIELPRGGAVEGPTAADDDALKPPSPQPIMQGREASILYIEDNPVNIKLVEKLVARRPNTTLVSIEDPREGLAQAAENGFDLILLDINLPGISGYEVLEQLRQLPTNASTPVIGLSANALPADIDRAREAGFNDYLTKPIKVKSFFEMLERWLTHGGD